MKVKSLSRFSLFVTPWTAAYQAPPSMGLSRQEYWSGMPLSSVLAMSLQQWGLVISEAISILLQSSVSCQGTIETEIRVPWGFPSGSMVKNQPAMQEMQFNPWIGKIPWRMKWQSSPVFLPGKSHGQRNLVGCSPWGHKWVGHDLATKQQRE